MIRLLLLVASLSVSCAGLVVTDASTRVRNLQTLFTNADLLLSFNGGGQEEVSEETPFQLFIDDDLYSSGVVSANESIPFVVEKSGTRTIRLELDGDDKLELKIQSYPFGVVIIPFVVLLISLLLDPNLVMAYYGGTAVAAIFVAGHVLIGSANVFTVYLVQALRVNVHIMLFLLFFSGIVGVLQRSGGLTGLTNTILRVCSTRSSLQLGIFTVGSILCWEDVSTVLITGDTMREAALRRNLSRQKLAFLTNAASLSSSIVPISATTGLILSVIQGELDRLNNTDLSAVSILLHSLRFAHYPLFMAFLVVLLTVTQREFGPMLVAERNAIVRNVQTTAEELEVTEQPEGQPALWWMAVLPLAIMSIAAYLSFLGSGESDDETGRGFFEKLEHASMSPALLDGVSTTVTVSILIGILCFVLEGERITFAPWYLARKLLGQGSNESSTARSIVNLDTFIRTLLGTAGRAFPTLINLVFSWSTAMAFSDAGIGNLIASFMAGGDEKYIAGIGFCVAMLFSMVTGSDSLAVSILIPLGLETALNASDGTVYATVGAVVGGAMAGRQLSPVSQTTILSASTSACTVWGHLSTQVPYVVVVCGFTIMLAIFPGWPNMVSYLMGVLGISGFVFLACKPILSDHGRYDIITELFVRDDNNLSQLKAESVVHYHGEKTEEASQLVDDADEVAAPDGVTSDSWSDEQGMDMAYENTC